MPSQTLVPTQAVQGPYPSLPVAATSLDITLQAVDPTNGNYFVADPILNTFSSGSIGGDLLIVYNTTDSPATITFTSQPDAQGRSGDIASYTVGAGVLSAFEYSQLVGWTDVNGYVYFLGSAVGLLVAVLKR
jgi:hypothetical protein